MYIITPILCEEKIKIEKNKSFQVITSGIWQRQNLTYLSDTVLHAFIFSVKFMPTFLRGLKY